MANYGTRYEKKDTPYGTFFMILVIMEVIAYFLGGAIGVKGTDLTNFSSKFMYAVQHPLSNINSYTPIMLASGAVIWMLVISYYMYYYRDYHMHMEHGDARWLDAEIANKELKDPDPHSNRILSEHLQVSLNGVVSNNNMLVIGSSGAYKTTSILHQNLLQANGSYVVLDVKGDTQRKLGKAMQSRGYTIKSLNFKNPEKSDRYNPFVFIENEDDLLRAVKALHQATRPKKEASTGDPFWDDAVDLYLQALFYYEWLDAKNSDRKATMNGIVHLTECESRNWKDNPDKKHPISELQHMINEMGDEYGLDYPPVRDYKKLKDGAPETVRSVILMINAMLAICGTAEVKRVFEDNDISIRDIGQGVDGNKNRPVALFLVIPDNNQVYNWIVSMFYTQMFDILIRLSDDEIKGPLPLRVEVHMDEFYAGAKPADSDILMGVVRSRNISMIPYFQSVAQLKTVFSENKWEIMLDNAAVVVFLGSGPTAESTHKFISDLLGSATVDSRDDNVHLGTNGSSGLNFKKTELKLMTPEQVKRMPSTECIIFIESRPPIYDTKAIPFDQPKKGFKASDWLKKRYSEALSLGDYEHPVYTIYDEKQFKYYTVERKARWKAYTDPDEIEEVKQMIKDNDKIVKLTISEDELIYLNIGPEKVPKEKITEMFNQAIEEENKAAQEMEEIKKRLFVMSDLSEEDAQVKKDFWDKEADFITLFKDHWDDLSLREQEIIDDAMTNKGLNNDQAKRVLLAKEEDMPGLIETFVAENALLKLMEETEEQDTEEQDE